MYNNNYILYTIDRIEGIYAVCENRQTGEFINISLYELPVNIHSGDILKYINGKYVVDASVTNDLKQSIQDRFNKLKKN